MPTYLLLSFVGIGFLIFIFSVASSGGPARVGKYTGIIILTLMIAWWAYCFSQLWDGSSFFSQVFLDGQPAEGVSFWILASMLVAAVLGHLCYLVDISLHWSQMTPSTRGQRVVLGIVIPPLVALGSLITVVIAACILFLWAFGDAAKSAPQPTKRHVDLRVSGYEGKRVGSIDTHTGEIKDRYGNRKGWIS